jgi:hypothetical protein
MNERKNELDIWWEAYLAALCSITNDFTPEFTAKKVGVIADLAHEAYNAKAKSLGVTIWTNL